MITKPHGLDSSMETQMMCAGHCEIKPPKYD